MQRGAPVPGRPFRPLQQGAAWLRRRTGLTNAGPAKATGASWVPEPRSSSPHCAGRHTRRRGRRRERLERFKSYGGGFVSQAARPGLRLGLWVPAAGKSGPALYGAAESRAQKPERPRARLGKGRGRHRLRRPAVRTLELGSPAPPGAGEPQAAWPLIVGKQDAPGKVQLVEGGLRFPLLNFPGLPGRPPPPFLTRL